MKAVDEGPTSAVPRGMAFGVKVWLTMVATPAVAFAVAMLVSTVVPGCHCDEGAGCRGCGLNGLIEFCLFGGFVGAICALMFGWPIIFIVKLFELELRPARAGNAKRRPQAEPVRRSTDES